MSEPQFDPTDPQPTPFKRIIERVGLDTDGKPVLREITQTRTGSVVLFITAVDARAIAQRLLDEINQAPTGLVIAGPDAVPRLRQ